MGRLVNRISLAVTILVAGAVERLESYAVSNLTLTSREFAGGFCFSGSVYNIFNTGYSDPVGAEILGSDVRQNGRDFRIQLAYAFRLR